MNDANQLMAFTDFESAEAGDWIVWQPRKNDEIRMQNILISLDVPS